VHEGRTQTVRRDALVVAGQAPSDMPAFQPDWRKSTVRNDRGDDGNVSIIRSLVRAIVLPGNRTHVRNLDSCRHFASEAIPKRQEQGGGFGALQAPATIRMRFLEACVFFARRLVCQLKGG
jgi:hypothetical protein